MNTTLDIRPGVTCILASEIDGVPNYEMTATSNIVNSTVRFHFAYGYEWVHIDQIVAVAHEHTPGEFGASSVIWRADGTGIIHTPCDTCGEWRIWEVQ